MALNLGSFRIQLADKLRTGFRAKYNLLLEKVIKDCKSTEVGFDLITHDDTKIEVDLTDNFYSKEDIDELLMTFTYATEEDAGVIRIATVEEALEMADDLTVITPYKLSLVLAYFAGRAFLAGEDLAYGDMVYLKPTYEDIVPEGGGDAVKTVTEIRAFKAIATSFETVADGFVEMEAELDDECFVKFSGTINQGAVDVDPHTRYYLSDAVPGAITLYPPGDPGSIQQMIGYSIGQYEVAIDIDQPLLNWAPVFEDLPPLIFILGSGVSADIDLKEYLTDYNKRYTVPEDGSLPELMNTGYSYRFLLAPDWITEHTVVFDNLSITGTAKVVGDHRFLLEVCDENKRIHLQEMLIKVLPKPVFKHSLLDCTAASLIIIGKIPGQYKIPEDKWDTRTVVDGLHDKIYIKVNEGSDENSNILIEDTQELIEAEYGSYRAFLQNDGIVTDVGLKRLEFATFIGDVETGREIVFFTLYDEEFLSKLRFELWNATKIGDLAVNATTRFKKPNFFNTKVVIEDLYHTKAVLTLSYEGEVIQTTEFTVIGTEYDVYVTVPEDQPAGVYTINAQFFDLLNLVYERQSDFEILDKVPDAEGGIKLVRMTPNTADYTVIQELELINPIVDLPSNFNALCTGFGGLVDYVQVEYFFKTGSALAEFNLTRYTKKPQFVEFPEPVSDIEVLAFDTLTSLEVGDIHVAPSTHRWRFTGKLGGAAGTVIGIQQADVTFREPLAPEDYSGLQMVTFRTGSPMVVVDTNMPKTGGSYPVPTTPGQWAVKFTTLDGVQEFDEIHFRGQLLTEDGWVSMRFNASADFIWRYYLPFPVTDVSDRTINTLGYGNPRRLVTPDGDEIFIDVAGEWRIYADVYLADELLETLLTQFELVEPEDLPELPENDCCGSQSYSQVIGDGITTTFEVTHGLDSTKLHVTVRKTSNNQEVIVENAPVSSNSIELRYYLAPGPGAHEVLIERNG